MSSQNRADNNTERKPNWEKISALAMIAICALGLIFPFAMQSYNHTTHDVKIHVCSVDSLPKDIVLSAADAAAVIKELEKKEIELEDKYNYVLQQRENEFKWQSYMSYVVGIIVAIFGFFGYKSIRDLKEDVSKNVSDIAKKETRKYLDEKLSALVNEKVEGRMNSIYESETMRVAVDKLKNELQIYFDQYFNEILVGTRTVAQMSKQVIGAPKSEQMQDLEDSDNLDDMFNDKRS